MDEAELAVPALLIELIEEKRWPSAENPWENQDAHPRVAGNRVEAIAPGETYICLEPYPFHTIGDELRGGNVFFENDMAAPSEIDPDRALIIADFGLGSDAPIVLDYRTDPPRVLRLAWQSVPAAPGSESKFTTDNHWVEMAQTFDDLALRLNL